MRRTLLRGFLFCFTLLSVAQLQGVNVDSLVTLLGEYENGKKRIDVLNELAEFYTMNSMEKVRLYGTEAFQMAEDLEYFEGVARAANSISWSYRIVSNHDMGLYYAQIAMDAAIKTGDAGLEADANYSLGFILREQKKYGAGRRYFWRAVSLYQSVEDFEGEAYATNAAGEAYRMQGNLDSALVEYEKAGKIFNQIKHLRGQLMIQNNLGLIHLAKEQWEPALDSLRSAFEGSFEVAFEGLRLESRDAMAQAYLGLGELDSCRKLATETMMDARKVGFTKYEGYAHKTLLQLAKEEGDLEAALIHQRNYLDIQQQIFKKTFVNQIDNLEMEIQIREKNARIQGLEKDQEIRSLTQWLLILGSAFLLIIFIVVLLDARKRRRTNLLLQTQNEELEQLNLEKDSLVNIVAHDLKSPLNKVGGLVEAMSMSGSLNQQQEQLVGMIRKVVGDGERLVRDLLDISYAEQLGTNSTEGEFDLNELLLELLDLNEKNAQRKNIEVNYSCNPKKVLLNCEQDAVGRIFDNLLSNALKYSPPNSKVWVNAGQEGDHAFMEIKDEGPGISPEDQSKMFRKFQKLSARPTGGESSNGLGLAIVKTLTERLDGRIHVESDLGKGARFKVMIPC